MPLFWGHANTTANNVLILKKKHTYIRSLFAVRKVGANPNAFERGVKMIEFVLSIRS